VGKDAPRWFDDRLDAFLSALVQDESGRLRTNTERRALAAAAREMIERIGWSDQRTPAPRVDTAAALYPDQLLANTFELRGLIAKGGVGEIYRARHRDLRSEHAVKILQPRYALDSTLTMLMVNEARLLQSVRHEGTVGCQGLLRDSDGRMLLVMDYLRGETLSRRLRQSPLSDEEFHTLAQRLASALAAIHAQRIVHQDISPDNIMLVEDSCAEATIIDFGLARSLAEPDETHMLVDFGGKYAWASPEQLAGPDSVIDTRSDLYSLGLVLAAASGCRLPMGDDLPSARAARLTVPSLDEVRPALRPLLRGLLMPGKNDRIQTAEELVAMVSRWKSVRWRGLSFKF
jgi:serine/threonine protein kinase